MSNPKTTLAPAIPNKANEKIKTAKAMAGKTAINSFFPLFSKLIHPYAAFIID